MKAFVVVAVRLLCLQCDIPTPSEGLLGCGRALVRLAPCLAPKPALRCRSGAGDLQTGFDARQWRARPLGQPSGSVEPS